MNNIPDNSDNKPSILGNLTVQIVIAMLIGAVLGVFIHNNYDLETAQNFSDKIKMLATVFIRLVQMIIAAARTTTAIPLSTR